MNYFNSNYFTYKNNELYCEGISLEDILRETGTPAYVYSQNYFIDRYKELDSAFNEIDHNIFYAVKSNFNLSVIKTFSDIGGGVDVNSEGELLRALKVGVSNDKIIFSGVGKTYDEIKIALEHDLLMIKAESEEELVLINEIATILNKKARVGIRVNPDVDPKTHPYISTGLAENKFGVDVTTAIKLYTEKDRFKNIDYTGIDMHIGSQITTVEPFVSAVEKLSEIFLSLKKQGIKLKHFDIGGGIGVEYHHERTFSPSEFAKALIPILKKLDCKVILEPGRYLSANAGILIAQVLYTKVNHKKNFIIIDAAMNDLLRPSIYGAYHHIQPVRINKSCKDISADIVGPVCESGDFLAKDRNIQECKRGDFLSVMSAGAYGSTMASNYNARRRPPEILVNGSSFKVIKKRESFEHLFFEEYL
ncbi:MAG TPA: diaminopimelate decarboxylase [Ignavibacteriaceae bacterium]|nr:diaminopimelate decarboxylase [Ignavibacteriaceae bacterium]